MKYLFERLEEQRRIPLKDATWEKIEPIHDTNAPKWSWQKDTANLPIDYMSSQQIKGDVAFNKWYEEFIKYYGTEGVLVEIRPTYWELKGNKTWDDDFERGARAVSKYYDEKKPGDYTGD